jgi:hypothetical protein
MSKSNVHCATSNGTSVQVDAIAEWNADLQQYEVVNVMDKGHWCDDCEDECRIERRPLAAVGVTAGAPA